MKTRKLLLASLLFSGAMLFIIGFLLFNNVAELFGDNITYDALNAWLFRLARGFGYLVK